MARAASPKTRPLSSPGARFRPEIEAALAQGLTTQGMTLRLTWRDASLLARDPATPVADVSYAGGIMRFLGVEVAKGSVETSRLDRGEDSDRES